MYAAWVRDVCCARACLTIHAQVSDPKEPNRAINVGYAPNVEHHMTFVGLVGITAGHRLGHESVPHFRPQLQNQSPVPTQVTESRAADHEREPRSIGPDRHAPPIPNRFHDMPDFSQYAHTAPKTSHSHRWRTKRGVPRITENVPL